MSKAKMMTVSIHLCEPMFDRPASEITREILAGAIMECDREELARHIKTWTKCPFSAEDL